jgi:hypothetical protein
VSEARSKMIGAWLDAHTLIRVSICSSRMPMRISRFTDETAPVFDKKLPSTDTLFPGAERNVERRNRQNEIRKPVMAALQGSAGSCQENRRLSCGRRVVDLNSMIEDFSAVRRFRSTRSVSSAGGKIHFEALYAILPRKIMEKKIRLRFLNNRYSIVQISKKSGIPTWLNVNRNFVSLTITDEELSIVCKSSCVPKNVDLKQSKGWIIIKIEEILDFTLCGILYSILKILKENEISVFSISTYNTDYILIKEEDKSTAKKCLAEYYTILSSSASYP